MKKSHLTYLRRIISMAANIKGNTLIESVDKIRCANLPIYQMMRDIVCDARYYGVIQDDLFWKNYSCAVIGHFIDSLSDEDWDNEEQRTGKKEDFLNNWLAKHIFSVSQEEQAQITDALNLKAGESGDKIPYSDDMDGSFPFGRYADGNVKDMTKGPALPGDSLPKQLQQFGENSKNNEPGLKSESHQAEAEFMDRLDPTLVELAKKIGRSGGTYHEVSGKFQSASRSDISGITIGNDLNSLLPSELAMLGSKSTENIFYQRYAQKRLQLFASASKSLEANNDKCGPIYICVDTSGSMTGQPEVVAKTLALAIAIVAQRDKRPICMVNYSHDISFFILTNLQAQKSKFLSFLSLSYSGGNDENMLFDFLFNKLPSAPRYSRFANKFKGADLLFISDFQWCPVSVSNKELIEKARSEGMKFYGLGIYTQKEDLDNMGESEQEYFDMTDGYRFLKQCDYRYLYNGEVTEYNEDANTKKI